MLGWSWFPQALQFPAHLNRAFFQHFVFPPQRSIYPNQSTKSHLGHQAFQLSFNLCPQLFLISGITWCFAMVPSHSTVTLGTLQTLITSFSIHMGDSKIVLSCFWKIWDIYSAYFVRISNSAHLKTQLPTPTCSLCWILGLIHTFLIYDSLPPDLKCGIPVGCLLSHL